MLSLPHSWAVVATAILNQLKGKGYKFSAISTNGATTVHSDLKSSLILPQQVKTGLAPRFVLQPIPTDVSLSYTIPPNLRKIPAKHRIQIYNFETNIMPPNWSQQMNQHAHLILPSSTFSKEIFLENGVKESLMEVLPHGFHPEIYNPNIQAATIKGVPDDKFKFLTVAISHWRKGYDLLLRAYVEEFKGDDSVVLIMKVGTDPLESKKVPCQVDVQKLIAELKTKYKYKWPEIRMISTRLDNLAKLYNAADVMVLPTRTECFSLTPLEASACKLPVITTNYGGHLDFLNESNSYLIDYKMRKAPREGQYWTFEPNAELAEPDLEHLKHLMRTVKNNYVEAKEKAELAYQVAQNYTWEKVVEDLLVMIKARGWNL